MDIINFISIMVKYWKYRNPKKSSIDKINGWKNDTFFYQSKKSLDSVYLKNLEQQRNFNSSLLSNYNKRFVSMNKQTLLSL